MNNIKIAVLIDGDNADANLIDKILNEAAKFGRITIKRIYADFTNQSMNSWKKQLNAFAIRPIQKFAYTTGKNSTDSALIIDAMDILHAKQVDGFCIVSSDSDYTGIAHRIREEGLFVMGIGKSHTPEAFVQACENFTYTEILSPKEIEVAKTESKSDIKQESKKSQHVKPKHQVKVVGKIALTNIITKKPINLEIVESAFKMVSDELTGLALASMLVPALKKVDPTFDIRNFGYTSLRKFIEALKPKFEIVTDGTTMSLKRGK